MRLDDKIAVVTGSSSGIGRAIARRFARDGALVAVHYGHDAEAAARTLSEIEADGGHAFVVHAVLSSAAQIERFYQLLDIELLRRTGSNRFDILVNNAGVSLAATIEQTSEQQFEWLFSVNVKGVFFVTQRAIPRLRDGGRVINISSLASRHPSNRVAAYSMTKAALDALTGAMAAELGTRNITVNTIAPATVATDMNADILRNPETRTFITRRTALGRVGEVDDIAGVAAFLASIDSAWVTGQYIEATGGFRL
jgi:3-oxoacyl-[acyl-carrier protein] reductase